MKHIPSKLLFLFLAGTLLMGKADTVHAADKAAIDPTKNIAAEATVSSTSVDANATYSAQAAIDGNYKTRWASSGTSTDQPLNLSLKFPEEKTIYRTGISAFGRAGTGRIIDFNIEYYDAALKDWKIAYQHDGTTQINGASDTTFTTIGSKDSLIFTFAPQTSDQWRLNITDWVGDPSLWELEMYEVDVTQIERPQNPPQDVNITEITRDGLTLNWKAPADAGESKYSAFGYQVVYGDKTIILPASQTSVRIGQLERDTTYSFTVSATNYGLTQSAATAQPVEGKTLITDKTELGQVIAEANSLNEGVEISVDGSDVPKGIYWVSREIKEALEDKIAAAQALINDENSTPKEMSAGIEALKKEMETFSQQKKSGTGKLAVTFGVISDVHIGSNSRGDSKTRFTKVLDWYLTKNVDAVAVAGDLTQNSGNANEWAGFKDVVKNRLNFPALPSPDKPQLLASIGNHDGTGDNARTTMQNMLGFPNNTDRVVNGYHFITVSPGEFNNTVSGAQGGNSSGGDQTDAYKANVKAWLRERIDKAKAEDASKPVFVFIHHPIKNTFYVSDEWNSTSFGTSEHDYFFKNDPQVVVFSGHIHTPNNDPRSIWQDGYTSVNTVTLDYFEMEKNGDLNQSYIGGSPGGITTSTYPKNPEGFTGNSGQGMIVKVEDSKVTIENYEFDIMNPASDSIQQIPQTWVFDVSKPSEFPYTKAIRETQKQSPVFETNGANSGAIADQITFDEIQDTNVTVTFKQAVMPSINPANEIVHSYKFDFINKQTGTTDRTAWQWSDFMHPERLRKDTYTQTIGKLLPDTDYELRIYAYGSLQQESTQYLTANFTTKSFIGNNVALNKNAKSGNGTASNGNDGNMDTNAGDASDPYAWSVDLGHTYQLNKFFVKLPKDNQPGWKYDIYYSDADTAYASASATSTADHTGWTKAGSYTTNKMGEHTVILDTPITGRYLKLVFTGKPDSTPAAWYQLKEFEAYGTRVVPDGLTNLALNKPSKSGNGEANLGNDGDVNTSAGSTTSRYAWAVDLADSYELQKLFVKLPDSAAPGWKFDIWYSSDEAAYTSANATSTLLNTGWTKAVSCTTIKQGEHTEIFDMPITARYLKFIWSSKPSSSDKYQLQEFEAYGIAPSHSVSVSDGSELLAEYNFPSASYGYEDQTGLTATVKNTGNAATGTLDITLSGAENSSFVLSTASISDIAVNDSTTFTVKPKNNLAAGMYSETVTVSGPNQISESFKINFEVKNASQEAPKDLSSTAETEPYAKNGTIAGVDSTMEYKWSTDSTYTAITGKIVTDLAPGTYHVRYAAKTNYDASPDTIVIIDQAMPDKPTVSKVTITPDAVTVEKGKTQSFSAEVSGTNAPSQDVTWSVSGALSTETSISAEGVLIVSADETAAFLTVTATAKADESKSGTAAVTVKAPPEEPVQPTVEKVIVTPGKATIEKGKTQTFSAEVSGKNNPPQDVTWSISGAKKTETNINAEGILTVDADETAAFLTVTATAKADESKSGTAAVTVKAPPEEPVQPTVEKVIVTPGKATVEKGKTQTFSAEVSGKNNPSQDVTWSVSGALHTETSISAEGILTVSAGETATFLTVTATAKADESKSGTAAVTVKAPLEEPAQPTVEEVTVTPAKAIVEKGKTQTFSAEVSGKNDPSQDVTWSVSGALHTETSISAEGILTVSADETATDLTVTATAKADESKSGTAAVTVKEPTEEPVQPTVEEVIVTPDKATVEKGKTQTFSAEVVGTNDPSQDVTWSVSGAEKIETSISAEGVLTVAADETAADLIVKATSVTDESKWGQAAVTVATAPEIPVAPEVSEVTVTPATVSVEQGKSQIFSAVVSGTNDPSQDVIWSVSDANSKETKIDEKGLLTVAADETSATLTVTATSIVDKSKSGTAVVTVTASTINTPEPITPVVPPLPPQPPADPGDDTEDVHIIFGARLIDQNGKPMAEATVEIHSTVQTTRTDANGYFRFENVETGEHTLFVKDDAGKVLATWKFMLALGDVEGISGNTITAVRDEPLNLTLKVNGDTLEVSDPNHAVTPPQKDELGSDSTGNKENTNKPNKNNPNKSNPNKNNANKNNPKTGDTGSPLVFLILLSVSSLCCLGARLALKKHRNRF